MVALIPVGCHLQSISCPPCLSSFLAQTYMAMPWLCSWKACYLCVTQLVQALGCCISRQLCTFLGREPV